MCFIAMSAVVLEKRTEWNVPPPPIENIKFLPRPDRVRIDLRAKLESSKRYAILLTKGDFCPVEIIRNFLFVKIAKQFWYLMKL